MQNHHYSYYYSQYRNSPMCSTEIYIGAPLLMFFLYINIITYYIYTLWTIKVCTQSLGAAVSLQRAVERAVVADAPPPAQREVALSEEVGRRLGLAGTRHQTLPVAVDATRGWLTQSGDHDCGTDIYYSAYVPLLIHVRI